MTPRRLYTGVAHHPIKACSNGRGRASPAHGNSHKTFVIEIKTRLAEWSPIDPRARNPLGGLVVAALADSQFIGNVLLSLFVTGIVLVAWWVYLFARLVFAVERYVDRR
jgi:hypothetical protein